MKIVVPVDEDKQTIVKRTGHCSFFAIYEDDKVVSYVVNKHHQNDHHHKHLSHEEHTKSHRKDVQQLQGCDVILVQAVGKNMQEALNQIGLQIKKIRQKDGKTADEVVKKFLAGEL